MRVLLVMAALVWPVDGEVVRGFESGPVPWVAGQHRGADLAVRRGEAVRAACAGTVSFAGPVARARAVTVRCGGRRVTVSPLARVDVRAGARVLEGAVVGRAGATLHLSVRERGRYVDPLPLLERPAPPVGPAPARRAPRVGRPPPPARPVAVPDPPMPWPAFAGAAVLAAGLLGAAARALRRASLPAADGLLHHDADLLRELGPASGPRLHDDRL